MSICRFFWDGSDVYVYGSDRGWECCGCRLYEPGWTCDYDSEEAMVAHLKKHVEAGHTVPECAFDAFNAEHPDPESFRGARDDWRDEHYDEYGYMWDGDHPRSKLLDHDAAQRDLIDRLRELVQELEGESDDG